MEWLLLGRRTRSAEIDTAGHFFLADVRRETTLADNGRRSGGSGVAVIGFAPVLEAGDQAPDFSLPDQDGREVKLSDFRGEPVVIYFYPKAATPGCTVQACGVRDHETDYAEAGAKVLGVSPDPVKKLRDFYDEQSLNFTLLSDQDHAVADAYGVWAEKSMYGKTYFGNERTTFVVDADGRVAKVLRKVKPAEHDELVLEALQQVAPPTV